MAKRVSKASAIEKVEKRIVPIQEASPYVTCLVFGRNKSGKTRFAASAPNVLIVDINERGTRSARRDYPGAHVFPVRTWPDISYVYWFLKEGKHKFKSVALDTVTAMQHLCMKHVLGDQEDRDPYREPSMPDRRSWGKLGELMKPQLLNFRNLPMNVIFVAQERTVGDEESGEAIEHVPDLSPAIRGVAMGAVDVIGRTYQKEVRKVVGKGEKRRETKIWESRMLVGPHDEFATGSREIELGRIIRNPTVPKIIEAGFSSKED